MPHPPKLLDQVRHTLRRMNCSIRTEETYANWIYHFILFHDKIHSKEMGIPEIETFFTFLAIDQNVAPSTQNQAFSAIMSKTEVNRLIKKLSPEYQFVAQILYGSGLRLMEGVRLRVKDIDFEQHQIIVCNGKGGRDRDTLLPEPPSHR